MSIALELRGIRKRYLVGAGSCRASADVLCGVDLIVRCGECAVIIGARGSGKTTLMLCAAGLLTPEAGALEWFGDSWRPVTTRRVIYHRASADLIRFGCVDEPHLHLVDIPDLTIDPALEAWVEQRRGRGDAVVLTTRDDARATLLAGHVHSLRAGLLHAATSAAPSRTRVAEDVQRR